MPSTPIENGQSGLTVRNTINTNFLQHDTDIGDLNDALATKQDTLVSGVNIKTINGNDILGGGNLVISSGVTNTQSIVNALIFG